MQTRTSLRTAIIILMALAAGCSPRHESNINLEQAHNPATKHLLSPGYHTIGIIEDGMLKVFFMDEDGGWLPDPGSFFALPENNRGIVAMGNGIIGVVQNQTLTFYHLEDYQKWVVSDLPEFELPRRYKRLVSMEMSDRTACIGIEKDGRVFFYRTTGDQWQQDERNTFLIPQGISGYYPLGDLTIAIVDEQRLGLYFLDPEEGWDFMDIENFVLPLPAEYEGVIPLDKRLISVLKDGTLMFYYLDLFEDRWVFLEDLYFELPAR